MSAATERDTMRGADGGTAGSEDPGGLWAPGRRALVAGLVLSMTFIAFEALAVIAIMPTVARELGGLELYGWVFSSFMLASLVGTVAAGIDADRHGLVRPYLAGLALFAIGLAVDALAPSMPVLVGGRVLQGLGAGAEPAVAYIAISRALPEGLRARMMAVLSSAWVIPGLLAPALSVSIAHLAGWRWVFGGLIPLVALAGGLAFSSLRVLDAGRSDRREGSAHRLRDALLSAGGIGLVLGGVGARGLPVALALAGAGLALALPALRRLLPGGTLHARRGLPATILLMGLLNFAFYAADAFVPLAVTTVLHRSTTIAGLIITACTLAWTAGAWVQTHTEGARQGRSLVRVGLALMLASICGVALSMSGGGSVALALVAWTLGGFGIGLAYAPLSLMMLREAPTGRTGWASASLTLSEVLGIALGTGLAGAAVAGGHRLGWTAAAGLLLAFGVAAAGTALALGLSGRLPSGPDR